MQKEARKKYHPCPFSGAREEEGTNPRPTVLFPPPLLVLAGTLLRGGGVLFAIPLFFQQYVPPAYRHVLHLEIWWGWGCGSDQSWQRIIQRNSALPFNTHSPRCGGVGLHPANPPVFCGAAGIPSDPLLPPGLEMGHQGEKKMIQALPPCTLCSSFCSDGLRSEVGSRREAWLRRCGARTFEE